jgi:hypothetical protein
MHVTYYEDRGVYNRLYTAYTCVIWNNFLMWSSSFTNDADLDVLPCEFRTANIKHSQSSHFAHTLL